MLSRISDDQEWVKLQCLFLVCGNRPARNVDTAIRNADKLYNYIMPKATTLELHTCKEDKNAVEVGKK